MLIEEGLKPPLHGILANQDYITLSAEEIYPLIPEDTPEESFDQHLFDNENDAGATSDLSPQALSSQSGDSPAGGEGANAEPKPKPRPHPNPPPQAGPRYPVGVEGANVMPKTIYDSVRGTAPCVRSLRSNLLRGAEIPREDDRGGAS